MFQNNNNIKLCLEDIMQVYNQSTFKLNRDFYIQPLSELILLLSTKFDFIVKVIKCLYSISKADNHLFATYHM